MIPTDNLTVKLIDSLYTNNSLSLDNKKIYEEYLHVSTSLIKFSKKGFKALNSIDLTQ